LHPKQNIESELINMAHLFLHGFQLNLAVRQRKGFVYYTIYYTYYYIYYNTICLFLFLNFDTAADVLQQGVLSEEGPAPRFPLRRRTGHDVAAL
jgi:hypothetical protein